MWGAGLIRRGATAVEFSLVAPVLLVLMAGVSTYAWVFLKQATLVDAVAEGARRASTALIDPDLATDPAVQLQTIALAEVRGCLARAGWLPADTTVQANVVNKDGLAMIEVDATVPIAATWPGWLFSTPATISYQLGVAASDQRALPTAVP